VEEEYITQLASLYWFTVEFGLCLEDGKRKVFGAGILSSVHELGRCLTEEAVTVPFDPDKAAVTPYPMYKVQDQYFVSSSIRDTTERIMSFAATIPRPFTARYNPYTQSIEILGTKEKLLKLTNDIRQDLFTLTAAINRMPAAFV
jgi:phenylalanine-4-hydroxylase